MAEVNASIPLQVRPVELPDQLSQYARLAQLQGLQGQQKLQDMQIKQAETETADNERLKQLFAGTQAGTDGTYDINSLAPKAMAISPKLGGAIVKQFGELNTQALNQQKIKIEGALQHFDVVGRLMSGVSNQQTYDAAVAQMKSLGMDTSQISPQYDPAAIKMNEMRAMSIKDQLVQQHQALTLAETQRHNQVSEGNQSADLGIRREQLNNTISNNTKTNDLKERELKVKEREQSGKPATESQAKANAFGQEMDAALKDADAALVEMNSNKPGMISQAAGNLPLIGKTAQAVVSSPAEQKYLNAMRRLITAKLRADSGATITQSEIDEQLDQMLPKLTDSKEVVAQKRAALGTAVQSVKSRGNQAMPSQKPLGNMPSQNAKGWALHTDANGNKAYVSPDGTQFEEAQ